MTWLGQGEAMELQDQVETLDSVPEPFRRFYVEGEGGYALDGKGLQGAIGNYDRLLGEKKQAAARMKELQEQLKKFDGIEDPEAARAAAAELQKLRDELEAKKHGTTDEEIEKLLRTRYERVLADHEAKLGAREKAVKERDEKLKVLEEQLSQKAIDSEVMLAAATAKGFVSEAVEEAIEAARKVFQLENGDVVPRTKDGQIMLGKDGDKPLTIAEWFESTKKPKPHWWLAQANGGSASSGGGATGGGKTMTQSEYDRDPLAARAKMKEGVRVVPD